jgi:hypothetical protein
MSSSRRSITKGVSLLCKMKVAVEEKVVHEEAHEQLTSVTPLGAVEE